MGIYLDDEIVELAGSDLGSVLGAAQQQLQGQGRVVVEVQVDGRTLVGDEVSDQQHQPIADTEVRLYSANPRELAGEVLDQVRQRLEDARRLQQEAATSLQQDNSAEALHHISSLIEIWMQTQQAVLYSVAILDIDLDGFKINGQPMAELAEELISQLKALKQLIGDGDMVALADVLAYEWPGIVDQWDELVGNLAKQIRS